MLYLDFRFTILNIGMTFLALTLQKEFGGLFVSWVCMWRPEDNLKLPFLMRLSTLLITKSLTGPKLIKEARLGLGQ